MGKPSQFYANAKANFYPTYGAAYMNRAARRAAHRHTHDGSKVHNAHWHDRNRIAKQQ